MDCTIEFIVLSDLTVGFFNYSLELHGKGPEKVKIETASGTFFFNDASLALPVGTTRGVTHKNTHTIIFELIQLSEDCIKKIEDITESSLAKPKKHRPRRILSGKSDNRNQT